MFTNLFNGEHGGHGGGESSDEEETCPLCTEPLDLTDRHLNLCHCGYRMCLWCWHQIMENAAKDNVNGRCPNCRTEYDKEKITLSHQNPEQLAREAQEEEKRKKKGGGGGRGGRGMGSAGAGGGGGMLPGGLMGPGGAGSSGGADGPARKLLQNVRVIQRKLVYVIGIPMRLCREETLRRGEYFGKYGKIVKISVNRNGVYSSSSHGGGPTGSAYVSFSREDDAMRCITQTDGTVLDGQAIRACFGTTKYCNAFLKYQECTNPDCLYLHEIGDHADSFTKEEMLARYGSKHQNFHELTHPLGMATAPPVGTAGESSQGGLPGGPEQPPLSTRRTELGLGGAAQIALGGGTGVAAVRSGLQPAPQPPPGGPGGDAASPWSKLGTGARQGASLGDPAAWRHSPPGGGVGGSGGVGGVPPPPPGRGGAGAPPPLTLGAGGGVLGGPGRLGALAGVFPPGGGAHPWGQPPGGGGALPGAGGLGYLQPGGGDGKSFGLGGGAPAGVFLGHPQHVEGRLGGAGAGGLGGNSRGFDALGMAVGLGGGLGGLFGRTGGGYSFDAAGSGEQPAGAAGVTPGLSALSMGGSGRAYVQPAAQQGPSPGAGPGGPGSDEQSRFQFAQGAPGRGGGEDGGAGGGGLSSLRTKSRFQFVEQDQGGDPSSAAAVGSFFNQFLPHVNVSVAGAAPGKGAAAPNGGLNFSGSGGGGAFSDPAIMGMGSAAPKGDAGGDGLVA